MPPRDQRPWGLPLPGVKLAAVACGLLEGGREMYEKLVLAVDWSEHAKRAQEVARELALLAGSEVRVVHVVEEAYGGRLGPYDTEDWNDAQSLVEGVAGALRTAGAKATAWCRRALVGRAALDSVSHKVLHLSHCPVLVTR